MIASVHTQEGLHVSWGQGSMGLKFCNLPNAPKNKNSPPNENSSWDLLSDWSLVVDHMVFGSWQFLDKWAKLIPDPIRKSYVVIPYLFIDAHPLPPFFVFLGWTVMGWRPYIDNCARGRHKLNRFHSAIGVDT